MNQCCARLTCTKKRRKLVIMVYAFNKKDLKKEVKKDTEHLKKQGWEVK